MPPDPTPGSRHQGMAHQDGPPWRRHRQHKRAPRPPSRVADLMTRLTHAGGHVSRANIARQPVQECGDHFACHGRGLLSLLQRRRLRATRVPELPRVPRQRHDPFQSRLESGVYLEACLAEFPEVVRLSERPLVVGEKALDGFLGGLLTVEDNVFRMGDVAVRSASALRRSMAALRNQAPVSASRTGSSGIDQFPFPHDS